MLTTSELVTVRAALLYWEEEMCPHDPELMRPYLENQDAAPLSALDVQRLRRQFEAANVRFAAGDVAHDRLLQAELFSDSADAGRASESGQVATVLLPVSSTP